MALEDELKKIRDEIARVKREISLLPEEKRRPYETRLADLEKQEATLVERMRKEEAEKLHEELLNEITRLRALIGILAAEVRAIITPKELEETRKMVSETRALMEGLLLPWKRQISKELEDRRLWAARVDRGDAELISKIEGKYAIYETYHMKATCETWVKTTSRPYVKRW